MWWRPSTCSVGAGRAGREVPGEARRQPATAGDRTYAWDPDSDDDDTIVAWDLPAADSSRGRSSRSRGRAATGRVSGARWRSLPAGFRPGARKGLRPAPAVLDAPPQPLLGRGGHGGPPCGRRRTCTTTTSCSRPSRADAANAFDDRAALRVGRTGPSWRRSRTSRKTRLAPRTVDAPRPPRARRRTGRLCGCLLFREIRRRTRRGRRPAELRGRRVPRAPIARASLARRLRSSFSGGDAPSGSASIYRLRFFLPIGPSQVPDDSEALIRHVRSRAIRRAAAATTVVSGPWLSPSPRRRSARRQRPSGAPMAMAGEATPRGEEDTDWPVGSCLS